MLPGGTYREDYLSEAFSFGWRCRNAVCGIWNGDEKDKAFLIVCQSCGTPRPRKDSVVRGTKGKR